MKLIERLAELEHKQWMKWAMVVMSEVSLERQERWDKYMIPYIELPEEVKEQDRKWARKVLKEVQNERRRRKVG